MSLDIVIAFLSQLLMTLTTEGCQCKMQYSYEVDCSKLGINYLPNCVPNNTLVLDLRDNNFQIVKAKTFERLVELRKLYLDRNLIARLESSAFFGLGRLKLLTLSANQLKFTDSYPHDIFEHLTSIETLKLHGNCNSRTVNSCSYPEDALMFATNVEILHIDGINGVNLGHGFASLQRLQHLRMSEDNITKSYCFLPQLTQRFFSSLASTPIVSIELLGCDSTVVERNTFSYLSSLKSLTVIGNPYSCFSTLFNISTGLYNTSIKTLRFSFLCQKHPPILYVDKEFSKLLSNTTLEYLELSNMNIMYVNANFVDYLPATLTALSLRGNILRDAIFSKNLKTLNITFLDVSSQTFNRGVPVETREGLQKLPLSDFKKENRTNGTFKSSNENGIIFIPWNEIKEGLEHVEKLDISYNAIETLAPAGDKRELHIKEIYFQGNILSKNIYELNNVFSDLTRLKVLNLSSNCIRTIPKMLFEPLICLKYLSLSNNYITTLDFSLTSMTMLEYLDLSGNELKTIAHENLLHFNILPSLRLAFYGNILPCNCESSEIVSWLKSAPASVVSVRELQCEYYNESVIKVEDIEDILHTLYLICDADIVLNIACAITIVSVLLLVLVVVFYYKRWRLKYLYNISKTAINPYHSIEGETVTLDIDVYISYDMDFLLEEGCSLHTIITGYIVPAFNNCGLVVKIREDILPGKPVTSEVAAVIRRSKKIIIFISAGYTLDFLNIFEFDTSVIEGMLTRRSAIVPVIVGDVDNMDLRPEVMSIVRVKIQENDFIYFPKSFIKDMDLFLRQLITKLDF